MRSLCPNSFERTYGVLVRSRVSTLSTASTLHTMSLNFVSALKLNRDLSRMLCRTGPCGQGQCCCSNLRHFSRNAREVGRPQGPASGVQPQAQAHDPAFGVARVGAVCVDVIRNMVGIDHAPCIQSARMLQDRSGRGDASNQVTATDWVAPGSNLKQGTDANGKQSQGPYVILYGDKQPL